MRQPEYLLYDCIISLFLCCISGFANEINCLMVTGSSDFHRLVFAETRVYAQIFFHIFFLYLFDIYLTRVYTG